MKLSKIFISFIFLLFTSLIAFSQNAGSAANEGSLNSGNIESQFDYLYKKSFKWTDPNTGQRYKTVKVNHLFKFKNNILDSLKSGRKKLLDIQKVVAAQKSEIEALKLELGTINKKLGSVTEEKDSIRFLGIPLSKASYNTILWTIIAALTAGLILFITRFKRSNAITVQAKRDKADIEQEYDEHRRRSLEREQKLRRELQDELNKQKYAQTTKKKK